MAEQTQVLIVDDHAAVRTGIRRILSRSKQLRILGEAVNGVEALHMIQELHPDIVLLDVEMPVMDGLETAHQIQIQKMPVKVLVLSAHDDHEFIRQMQLYGVYGYLLKDDIPAILIETIEGIAKGKKGWISPRISQKFPQWKFSGSGHISSIKTKHLHR